MPGPSHDSNADHLRATSSGPRLGGSLAADLAYASKDFSAHGSSDKGHGHDGAASRTRGPASGLSGHSSVSGASSRGSSGGESGSTRGGTKPAKSSVPEKVISGVAGALAVQANFYKFVITDEKGDARRAAAAAAALREKQRAQDAGAWAARRTVSVPSEAAAPGAHAGLPPTASGGPPPRRLSGAFSVGGGGKPKPAKLGASSGSRPRIPDMQIS